MRRYTSVPMPDSTQPVTVCFSHGQESGPWGSKIKRLAQVARTRGCHVESIDYTGMVDPELRVSKLLASPAVEVQNLVLVGSSMGGYVATLASATLEPTGLFLMAPAFYMPGFANQDPRPGTDTVSIVHAWEDEVILVDHSLRFARKFGAELHLVHGDHRLIGQIALIEHVFGFFLDQIRLSMEGPSG